jgi:hypothetical protein
LDRYHHFYSDAEINWLLHLGLEDRLFFQERRWCPEVIASSTLTDRLIFVVFPLASKTILASAYLGKIANWRVCDISALEWISSLCRRQKKSVLWEPLLRIKFGPYVDEVPLSWMIRLRQRMNSRRALEKTGYSGRSTALRALLATLRQMNVGCISTKVEESPYRQEGDIHSGPNMAGKADS